jgi:hypothetical protein
MQIREGVELKDPSATGMRIGVGKGHRSKRLQLSDGAGRREVHKLTWSLGDREQRQGKRSVPLGQVKFELQQDFQAEVSTGIWAYENNYISLYPDHPSCPAAAHTVLTCLLLYWMASSSTLNS